MKDKSMLKVKVLMAKQFTDDEKIILAGIDTGYSISDIDNGKFKLKKLQSDLAEHVSRFTRRYNPDARIIAYLRKRAEEFRTEVPSFLNKRKTDASAVQEPVKKRARPQGQRRLYQGFMMCANPVCISNHVAHTHDTAQCHYYNAKGKGTKGKDKGYNIRFDGKGKPHDGKGKGLKGKKGKIQSPKGTKGGKGVKGKSALGNRIQESSAGDTNITESVKSMVCDFCHKPNHVRQNCRKLQALNNSKTYRQARNRHDKRRQFLFTMMENSVFSPNTCSWCLGVTCDGGNCYPPDDPVFFTETNNIFCEEILPLVKNAKLELPLDSADPLIPYQFHFEDTGWGQQWGSNFDYEEYQRDHSSELWEKEMAPSLWYDNAPGWGHPYHDQDWYWQAQATSTWQDENLLDGSAANEEVESISKDVLLEENSASNSIGLQIEEDDVQEQLDEDASGGSSEEV
jgi:hypothetical protein